MIRSIFPDDKKALIGIADAVGLFSPEELEEFDGMLTEYFDGNLGNNHFWITYDDGEANRNSHNSPRRTSNF